MSKGTINISRPSCGDDRQVIEVTIRDSISGISFVTAELTLEDFALALTGRSMVDCDLTLKALNRVGMRKLTESRELRWLSNIYSKDDCARAVREVFVEEDGWLLDPYLGHKGQITQEGDTTVIKYSVYKFVPVEGEENV
ncbi:TPA: hypothetical protein LU109_003585 [Enterobacter hormaechei subsp. xiangfangensis]|nr:hypothetical protein [Enterobacter hormaechei subsp. xiangfangensis]